MYMHTVTVMDMVVVDVVSALDHGKPKLLEERTTTSTFGGGEVVVCSPSASLVVLTEVEEVGEISGVSLSDGARVAAPVEGARCKTDGATRHSLSAPEHHAIKHAPCAGLNPGGWEVGVAVSGDRMSAIRVVLMHLVEH